MVNTFLPYASFTRSARVLDMKRLGKQRVEVLQLLKALHGETTGWVNHPAAVMWRGHEAALCNYGLYICDEWISRGYNDTCREKIRSYFPFAKPTGARALQDIGMLPWWFGWKALHASHRSNLKRKDPEYYSLFVEPPTMPYVWPLENYPFYRLKHAAGSNYT